MARAPTSVRRGSVVAALAVLLSTVSVTAAQPASSRAGSAAGIVTSWNAIAFRTISAEGKKPPPVAQLYLALVSTAVYNAVVTVEGGGRPTLRQPAAHGPASSDVAAATAAHDVLVRYFPASEAALDADYDAWLAGIPDDDGRVRGQRVGHDAAEALLVSRVDDGRDAPVTPPRPLDPPPGMWAPTASGEFLAPWLAFTRPVLIRSPRQFDRNGPDSLRSDQYAADVEEVRTMGAATGSRRSPEQTDLALFFSDNPVRQYQDAMRDLALRRDLDIVDAARMFAAVNGAGADALITCWREKYVHYYWRPETAIHQADADGNPATVVDAAWTPFGPTPPYPEYPSGHACLTGSTAHVLEELFGRVEVTLESTAPGVVVTTRTYSSERAWLDDVTDARIWLGFHFRDAMDDGLRIGRQVADAVHDRFGRAD
ncbi:vanadium-dependent haloperoxidase [Geodermatophilus sp. YIM 151500]|uniref:vanadium-dependent haloperoxidase n=1 Tax=Geodermatophilus sp. YIM 151500 TaxID=2984531 RepID=UPI0021E3BB79|nr:vanadium-dependent haloperoxidase [Geodermatophilus sp. YIM 151500]MCV2489201.1 vanadium-dependent haloperoxidase [Geodermatophilus sp. YIM 151500]